MKIVTPIIVVFLAAVGWVGFVAMAIYEVSKLVQ